MILSTGGQTPTYDANDNLTIYHTTTYTYDPSNRLKTAKAGTNATVNFTYDPAGRLHKTDGSTGTRFFYDGADMIAEYDDAGAITKRYVHGPGVDEALVWYDGSGTGTKRWLGAESERTANVRFCAHRCRKSLNNQSAIVRQKRK